VRSSALPVLARDSERTLLAADVMGRLAAELSGSRMTESTLYLGASRSELARHFLQLLNLALFRTLVRIHLALVAEIRWRLYPLEEAATTVRTTASTKTPTNALRL